MANFSLTPGQKLWQVFDCNVQFAKNGGKKVRQKLKLNCHCAVTILKKGTFFGELGELW